MSEYLNIILLFAISLYSFIGFTILFGFIRVRRWNKIERNETTPFVSVIVVARNEETNLKRLLPQLLTQNYSSYEVIVVNDRSDDRTREVIEEHQLKFSHLRTVNILNLSNDLPAKKNALQTGIQISKGEILCFTDADCVVGKNWLQTMSRAFVADVGLVAGYSPYDRRLLKIVPKSFLSNFLFDFIEYEGVKGAELAIGSIGIGLGWLCTGRNLAFRRCVFNEVNGYENIKQSISGDDDLFLQQVRKSTNWKIRYILSPENFVGTVPPISFNTFVRQRKRHFSAGKYYSLPLKAFYPIYQGSNLVIFLGLLGWLFKPSLLELGIGTYGIKLFIDALHYIVIGWDLQGMKFLLRHIQLEILNIFYFTFIGPLGLIGKFEWKSNEKTIQKG